MNHLEIAWAGKVDYDVAWEWQKAETAVLSDDPSQPDKLILLEHPPTFTLGRRGTLDHLLLDEAALDAQGFALRWVDRGGDITYHGPGQLVGYPLINLKRLFASRGRRPDLHQYLRDLEQVIIDALATLGIKGWRFEGYTGVWVDGADGPRKIAAIGIKVNVKGISSHGFALNVNPNLTHFGHIIPCGIQEHGVTSISQQLNQPLTTLDLLEPITAAFHNTFTTPNIVGHLPNVT